MRKIFILFLHIVIFHNAFSQATGIQWEKSLGGTSFDMSYSVQQTFDGSYIISGETDSNDGDVTGYHGNGDFWIVKINNAGNIIWQKCLGGSSFERAYSIYQTSDRGYIVAGETQSNDGDVSGNHGGYDYWIVKLDSMGSIQWQKTAGGSGEDAAMAIVQTFDGGYIAAGRTNSNDNDVIGNHGDFDYWIVKFNVTGIIQWQKCLGGTGDDRAYSIKQTSDRGYIVAGSSNSNDGDVNGNHGSYDYWIVKLDSMGSLQWQKSLGGTSLDASYSILQTSDGGYIATGNSNSNDGDVSGNHEIGTDDYWVVKLNSSGNLIWQKCLGGTGNESAYSIESTVDSGYVMIGYSNLNTGDVNCNNGNFDYWIVKLDITGNLNWQKCLGGTGTDYGKSIVQTFDGGFIVTGYSDSNDGDVSGNHGNSDYWIVKLTPDVGIKENNSISDVNIHPNPVTDKLIVRSPEFGDKTEIIIYDLMGEKLFSQKLTAKSTEQPIDVSALAKGVYVIEISNGKSVLMQKMIKQ